MIDEKKKIKILLVVYIIFLINMLMIGIIPFTDEARKNFFSKANAIPLFGLSHQLNNLVIYIVIPLIGGTIFLIIFTFIITPLFLRLKRQIWRNYKDAYIDIGEEPFYFKKFLKRGIFMILLNIGIIGVIYNLDILDYRLFASPENVKWATESGFPLKYENNVLIGLMSLIAPFVIGIWSVGWAMDDAALIHYRLPKGDSGKLFEIEPIHYRYNSLIKGYAGISALVFYIGVIIYYIVYGMPIYFIFILSIAALTILASTIPVYLIYWKLCRPRLIKKLRKNLIEVERITEIRVKS